MRLGSANMPRGMLHFVDVFSARHANSLWSECHSALLSGVSAPARIRAFRPVLIETCNRTFDVEWKGYGK